VILSGLLVVREAKNIKDRFHMPKRSKKINLPVALEWDRFVLRAKQARNTLQPTQWPSPQMPQRKPAGLAGLHDTGDCRAGGLEKAPGRLVPDERASQAAALSSQ
jgi:hypothetical protein